MLGQPPPPLVEGARHVVVQPIWVKVPTGEDLSDAYPTDALRAAVPGLAVLACRVSIQGAATGCEVLQEAPAGLGFGDAALVLSLRFQFKPKTLDGQPTDDGQVVIPLRFKVPGAPTQGPARAPRLWREAVPGQPLPTASTAHCPGEPDKLCTSEPFAWAAAPEPWSFAGLYGATAFVCRVAAAGALEACKTASLTTGAHVQAAQRYVRGYRAPPEVNGRPTVGASATFIIVPPGPPD